MAKLRINTGGGGGGVAGATPAQAAAILQNTTATADNLNDINAVNLVAALNAANIGTNTTGVATNLANISNNTNAIALNTTGVATNLTAIAGINTDITTLENQKLDAPISATPGHFAVVDATGDDVEYIALNVLADFIDLNDTPSAYTGEAGKFLTVNGTEDGVEFLEGVVTTPTFTPGVVTDITAISGTTVVYNVADPANGQTSVNSVEYYDDGAFRYIYIAFESDEDDVTVWEVGGTLIPVGGRILDAQSLLPNLTTNTGTPINCGVDASVNNRFTSNRANAIDADNHFAVWLKVYNPNGGNFALEGTIPVEDIEEVIYAKQTGLAFATVYSIDNSATWNDVITAYEYIRFNFEVDVTGVADDVLRTITIRASDLRDDTRVRFEYGSGVVDFQPGTLTGGDFSFVGSTVDEIALSIYGVKAQKTVLSNENVLVDDQASSGYYDIGTMRIQWGTIATVTNQEVITMPAAFADTSYSLVTSINSTSFNNRIVSSNPTTVNTFTARVVLSSNGAADGAPISWQAIGIKP